MRLDNRVESLRAFLSMLIGLLGEREGLFILCAVAAVVSLLFSSARKPHDQTLLISYIEGDVSMAALRPRAWDYGEDNECELASRGSVPPDKRGDIMLCGSRAQFAWSITRDRKDVMDAIYDTARTLEVRFHRNGHSSSRGGLNPKWTCRRGSEGLDCE